MSDDTQTLKEIGRTLKEISSRLREKNLILRQIHWALAPQEPLTEKSPTPDEPKEVKDPPKVYGWSMAASVQREGGLRVGDIMIEKDESRWAWVGEGWERIELPSGEK